jgi:hypothetical protein
MSAALDRSACQNVDLVPTFRLIANFSGFNSFRLPESRGKLPPNRLEWWAFRRLPWSFGPTSQAEEQDDLLQLSPGWLLAPMAWRREPVRKWIMEDTESQSRPNLELACRNGMGGGDLP